MKSVLVWINSAPASPNLAGAFQLARQMRAQGREVSVFLAQDAVLAGVHVADGSPAPVAQALQAGIATYVLDEDLRLRGYPSASLWAGVQTADYAHLVGLLDRHERVLGAL